MWTHLVRGSLGLWICMVVTSAMARAADQPQYEHGDIAVPKATIEELSWDGVLNEANATIAAQAKRIEEARELLGQARTMIPIGDRCWRVWENECVAWLSTSPAGSKGAT